MTKTSRLRDNSRKQGVRVASGWLFASLAGVLCITAVAAEEAPLGADKSTLETISLQSLESDDLAEAGIAGSLEAPAAGESIEVPEELKKTLGDLDPRDTREDLGRFNVPAQFINRPDPMAVGGRTYNYDYIYRTER